MINEDSVEHVSTELTNITSNGTIIAQEEIMIIVDMITYIVNNVTTIDQAVMLVHFYLNVTTFV